MVEILHALESGRPHSLQPPAAAAAAAGEGDRSYAHPHTTAEVQLAECGLDPSRTQPSPLEPLERGQESQPDQPVLASATVTAAPIPSQSLQPEPVD
jgi:hypothetical protein